ncbi:DinB family protein [Myroides odoratimimus]|uniref:Uncharacterized protein n=3 Tax=Flavobacteriaceae TaxID=49546 RepID=A0A0S7EGV0_9FLAO|nr:DinB family protein [Myroides odoratimimus]ALU25110.1 hypothetical protein AS202_02575 [Myroides odoratimimus]EHO05744.1 hypothetical protein HMPREF9714_03151 [Myroides odoratimimus CCUG 12901]EHO07297.1 hypothetical protein HMPREF9712_02696 [Myroides odoratimimus CCUG 10230]EPH08369.1 hypothetical protein HMPREF9713_03325 [Myroides odoratimimus CCUG 12700]MCA4791832.1 DinB family protein [Myroides odoratimimus]
MMTNQQVLDRLCLLTDKHLEQLQYIKRLSTEQLNYKPTVESWNILQCIAHLNYYFDFYLPQFKSAMNGKKREQLLFKSGVIGKYFANILLYKENQKPIKSPKQTNPIDKIISKDVIITFEANLIALKDIIKKMPQEVVNNRAIVTMFSNWYKLNVGDSLRIVVYHNDRHFHQIQKLLP